MKPQTGITQKVINELQAELKSALHESGRKSVYIDKLEKDVLRLKKEIEELKDELHHVEKGKITY